MECRIVDDAEPSSQLIGRRRGFGGFHNPDDVVTTNRAFALKQHVALLFSTPVVNHLNRLSAQGTKHVRQDLFASPSWDDAPQCAGFGCKVFFAHGWKIVSFMGILATQNTVSGGAPGMPRICAQLAVEWS